MKILEYRILIAVDDHVKEETITNIFNEPPIDQILGEDFGYITNFQVDLINNIHVDGVEDLRNDIDEDNLEYDDDKLNEKFNKWMEKSFDEFKKIVEKRE